MFDVNNLPNEDEMTQIYWGGSALTTYTWNKPKGARAIFMLCFGSGAGGGGQTAISSLNGSGGGGSGAYSCCVVPAIFVPNVLYVQPGISAGGGAAGNFSWISINTALTAIYLKSGAAVPTAVAANTVTGGTAGTISTVTLSPFSTQGIYAYTAGVAGGTGGTGAAGTDLAPSGFISGGGGGGGYDGALAQRGSNITPVSTLLPALLGAAGGATETLMQANPGVPLYRGTRVPLQCTGSSGGGCAGAGGLSPTQPGSTGYANGGAGQGATELVALTGGRSAPGLIIIACV